MNHDTGRRAFLKSVLTGTTAGALVGAGLLTPGRILAAWPAAAFDSTTRDAALEALYASGVIEESDRVKLDAPDIAENGAVVPIRVETDLEGVESISIIAAENPSPLAAVFELTARSLPSVSTRIKMAMTSDVLIVVKSNGTLFSTQKRISVTVGGCG